MSDTPKTDSQTTWSESEGGVHKHIDGTGWLVDTDFARTLERENNQLRADLKQCAEALRTCQCSKLDFNRKNWTWRFDERLTEKALSLPSVQSLLSNNGTRP